MTTVGSVQLDVTLGQQELQNQINQARSKIAQGFKDVKVNVAFQGLNDAFVALDKASSVGSQFSQGMQIAAGNLTQVANELAVVSNQAKQVAINFDSAKAAAATLAGGEGAAALAARTRELTTEMKYQTNSVDLLKASYDVLSSGYSDVTEVSEILRQSTYAAAGGFTDVGTVSDATTSILNSYKVQMEGLGDTTDRTRLIVDQMIVTQNVGKITVGQYAGMIGRTANIAAAANVPLQEMNAAIADATAKGVPAEGAIAGVGQAILAIVDPTQRAKQKAKELGIEFSGAALRTKGLEAVLSDVYAKASKDDLAILFGNVQALGVASALGNDKLTGFRNAVDALNNSAGVAKKQAEEMAKSFQGQLTKASNQAQEAMLSLGEGIMQASVPVLTVVNQMLQAFNSLPAPVKNAAGVTLALTAGFAGLAAVTATILATIPPIVAGYTTVTALLGAKTVATTANTLATTANTTATVANAAATTAAIGGLDGFVKKLVTAAFNMDLLAVASKGFTGVTSLITGGMSAVATAATGGAAALGSFLATITPLLPVIGLAAVAGGLLAYNFGLINAAINGGKEINQASVKLDELAKKNTTAKDATKGLADATKEAAKNTDAYTKSVEILGIRLPLISSGAISAQKSMLALDGVLDKTGASFNQAMNLAQEYNNITKRGGQVTSEWVTKAKARSEQLAGEIEVLKGVKGATDEQNALIQAEIGNLTKAKNALDTRVESYQKSTKAAGDSSTAASKVAATAKEEEKATKALTDTLDKLAVTRDINTAKSGLASQEQAAKLAESLAQGTISVKQAESDRLRTQRESLDNQLKAAVEYQNQVNQTETNGKEASQKLEQEKLKAATDVAKLREQIAQNSYETDKETLDQNLKVYQDSQVKREVATLESEAKIQELRAAGELSDRQLAERKSQLTTVESGKRLEIIRAEIGKLSELQVTDSRVKQDVETRKTELTKEAATLRNAIATEEANRAKEAEARKVEALNLANLQSEVNLKKSLANRQLTEEQATQAALANREANLKKELTFYQTTGKSREDSQRKALEIEGQLADISVQKTKATEAARLQAVQESIAQRMLADKQAIIQRNLGETESQALLTQSRENAIKQELALVNQRGEQDANSRKRSVELQSQLLDIQLQKTRENLKAETDVIQGNLLTTEVNLKKSLANRSISEETYNNQVLAAKQASLSRELVIYDRRSAGDSAARRKALEIQGQLADLSIQITQRQAKKEVEAIQDGLNERILAIKQSGLQSGKSQEEIDRQIGEARKQSIREEINLYSQRASQDITARRRVVELSSQLADMELQERKQFESDRLEAEKLTTKESTELTRMDATEKREAIKEINKARSEEKKLTGESIAARKEEEKVNQEVAKARKLAADQAISEANREVKEEETRNKIRLTNRLNAIKQEQLLGVTSEKTYQESLVNLNIDRVSAELELANQKEAKLKELKAAGFKSDAEFRNESLALQEEISAKELSLTEALLDAKTKAIQATIQGRKDELEAIRNIEEAQSNLVTKGLTNQLTVSKEINETYKLASDYVQQGLEHQIRMSELQDDQVKAEQLRGQLLKERLTEIDAEYNARVAELEIQIKLKAIELERQRLTSELAISSQEIALLEARNAGASPEKIDGLTKMLNLRKEELASIKQQAEIEKTILSNQLEQANKQKEINRAKLVNSEEERLTQANLKALEDEQKLRKEISDNQRSALNQKRGNKPGESLKNASSINENQGKLRDTQEDARLTKESLDELQAIKATLKDPNAESNWKPMVGDFRKTLDKAFANLDETKVKLPGLEKKIDGLSDGIPELAKGLPEATKGLPGKIGDEVGKQVAKNIKPLVDPSKLDKKDRPKPKVTPDKTDRDLANLLRKISAKIEEIGAKPTHLTVVSTDVAKNASKIYKEVRQPSNCCDQFR